jgi:hypothetical protein
MKTLADGRFFSRKEMPSRVLWETGTPLIPDRFSISEALFFSWSLPISVLITGAENAPLLEEKLTFAKEFVNQSEDERSRLLDRIAGAPELEEVEYYKTVKPETIL